VESEGGVFLPGTLGDRWDFDIIMTPDYLETPRGI